MALPLEMILAWRAGEEREETIPQETMLVLGRVQVPPGASVVVSAQSLVPMRLVGMRVDARSADYFDVEDLRVGKNNQILALTSLPARLFVEEMPVGTGEVALPGQEITIRVHNHDPEPRDFEAILVGVFQAPRDRRWW